MGSFVLPFMREKMICFLSEYLRVNVFTFERLALPKGAVSRFFFGWLE